MTPAAELVASTDTAPLVEPVTGMARLLDDAIAHVTAAGRDDLADELARQRDDAARPECTVLIIGEFKKGKSSLVNALLNWRACPVDADVTTAVPTVVRWGARPLAWAMNGAPDEPGTERRPLSLAALADAIAPPAGSDPDARLVEVELPRALLRRGLVLVDTPGVNGGLTSAHAAAALRALALADAIVFVSDGSQEYTASELEFLHHARSLCPNLVCVLTKVDLYPSWRRVLELDRGHLARAGIDAEVLPLAAPLRHWGVRVGSSEMEEESGYPALTDALVTRVVADKEEAAQRRTLQRVLDALRQVEAPLAAEHETLANPGRADELLAGLVAAKGRAEALRSGATARWSQTLGDRFGDMISNVDLDLARRLREIRRRGTDAITTADPTSLWPEFEPWLYQNTNDAMVEHFSAIRAEAAQVGTEIAQLFDDEALDVALPLESTRIEAELGALTVTTPTFERFSTRDQTFIAVRGATSGTVITGMVATFVGFVPLLTPVAAVLALTLGRKSLVAARDNQLKQQRAEGLRALQAFLEETELVSRKASRDMLRRANQVLRDHFQERAEHLLVATARAVEAAAQALKTERADGPRRLQLVARELELVRRTIGEARQELAALDGEVAR